MKLLNMSLSNFRQFAGDQKQVFASDPAKVVTLLFGANGSGKTTLLNAFTWCLYGKLSDDVEGQERLVTDFIWADASFGQELSTSVEIEFEHNGKQMRVRREVSGVKNGPSQQLGPDRLRVWETDESGATSEVTTGPQRINSILPEPLSRFFFFNGERIESLVSRGAYSEIKQAIKSLLGLEQVERAIEHLPKVERKLQAELRKQGDQQLSALSAQITQGREKLDSLQREIATVERDNHSLVNERELVLGELAKHQSAGPLQERRERIVGDLEKARAHLHDLRLTKRLRVAQDGPIAFIAGLAESTEARAEALTRKGELPAPIKRGFVESLLEDNLCLCGTELPPGSAARSQVETWRSKAGLAESEANWQRLRGAIGLLSDQRRSLQTDLEQLARQDAELRADIQFGEEQLTLVNDEMKDIPLTDVKRLNDKQSDLSDRISEGNRRLGGLRVEKENTQTSLDSLTHALKSAEVKDQMANRVRSRVSLVEEVQDALTKILEIRTESVRRELDERIRNVFQRITVKPFEPELTNDFELRLVRTDGSSGQSVSKSTGENQILSLSFVAAVSELAAEYRQRNNERAGLLDEGGQFPIVMDAAFGSLDENYQRDVSEALSRLAPQMIVLVSKSQGLGTVMEQLEPHIGRLGVITSHTTKATDSNEDIELRGVTVPYIRTQEDNDCAKLMEVGL